MWNLWELIMSFGTVNFMRAEHCERKLNEVWALQMWILWELSIVNGIFLQTELRFVKVNFIRAELCKCEFMRTEHCKYSCELKILSELSIANVNFRRAEHCECEFYGRWALLMWILWELSFAGQSCMGVAHCEWEFHKS